MRVTIASYNRDFVREQMASTGILEASDCINFLLLEMRRILERGSAGVSSPSLTSPSPAVTAPAPLEDARQKFLQDTMGDWTKPS